MLPKAESACFVIADISGYTNFLAGVELDHAQDIIADLMDTVVKGLRPPFRLAKFEGDAAFVYALTEKVDGSLLQDAIESAYFAFRKRLRNIKQASACECNACSTMQNLDLKFVIHHGEMIKHKMGGREELAGTRCHPRSSPSEERGERDASAATPMRSTPTPASRRWASIPARRADRAPRNHRHHRRSHAVVRDLEEAWQKENERQRTEVTRDERRDGARVRHRRAALNGVGAFHAARASAEMAGRGRGAGECGGRPARSRHHQSLHARQGRDHRGDARLAPVRLPDADHAAADAGGAEGDDDLRVLGKAELGTHIEIRVAKPKPKDQAFLDQVAPSFRESVTLAFKNLRLTLEGRRPRSR